MIIQNSLGDIQSGRIIKGFGYLKLLEISSLWGYQVGDNLRIIILGTKYVLGMAIHEAVQNICVVQYS